MARRKKNPTIIRSFLVPFVALIALLAIASYALLGPTGIIAWTDYRAALNQQSQQLANLQKERDSLRNRQRLLDQNNVDPDLAGELMRKELNVAAPDEIIVPMN